MIIELTYIEINHLIEEAIKKNYIDNRINFLKFPQFSYYNKSLLIDNILIEVISILGIFPVKVKGYLVIDDLIFNKENNVIYLKTKFNLFTNIPFISSKAIILAINKLMNGKIFINQDEVIFLYLNNLLSTDIILYLNNLNNIKLEINNEKVKFHLSLNSI